MSSQTRVVVVEDDEWKRSAMALRLATTDGIEVAAEAEQDVAAGWPRSFWTEVDAAVVDIYDDRAPGEIGSDLYSGIKVVERVRNLPVRCIAVTPACAHPLVQLRLHQAAPDFVYHRWQVGSVEALREAICFPSRDRRLSAPDAAELRDLGARRLRANELIRRFETSPLHGVMNAHSGHKELVTHGVSRGDLERMKRAAIECGYEHAEVSAVARAMRTGDRVAGARWPDIRSVLLMLLGRLDAPPSEFDRPWWSG